MTTVIGIFLIGLGLYMFTMSSTEDESPDALLIIFAGFVVLFLFG